MDGDKVNEFSGVFEHRQVPFGVICSHGDHLDGGIQPFHELGILTELFCILTDTAMAHLPFAIHLVSNAPVLHTVWLRMA